MKAAQIWKDMGHDQDSCGKLLIQLRKYKSKRAPFNHPYNKSDPAVWWEAAQNAKEEWELQALALRLFAITPHSASCERSFSILGWFYGQRRTNLAIERVEGMCKLHTFYITNAKQELPYYSVDITEELLRNQMIHSIREICDELEEFTDDDFEFIDEITDMDIDTSQQYNLNIIKEVNIDSQIFNMERKGDEIEVIVSQRRSAVVLSPSHDDFDVAALVAKEIDNYDDS